MQRTNTLNYVLVLFSILKSYDFESACLPRCMARACSLSLILFPWAPARCKIDTIIQNNKKKTSSYNKITLT